MNNYLVSINDLPPSGKEFTLEDQDIWEDPIKKYKMDCRITSPMKASIFVMAADEGCLVRGELTGAVTVPCNRCAEDAHIGIETKFDEYEEIPEITRAAQDSKNADGHIVFDRNAPMLNLAEVAWEQFMLSLPSKPLCDNACKGLCPQCGANLNKETCSCGGSSGDPRLAALRDLKIDKK